MWGRNIYIFLHLLSCAVGHRDSGCHEEFIITSQMHGNFLISHDTNDSEVCEFYIGVNYTTNTINILRKRIIIDQIHSVAVKFSVLWSLKEPLDHGQWGVAPRTIIGLPVCCCWFGWSATGKPTSLHCWLAFTPGPGIIHVCCFNFDALAQASGFQFKRRHVVFICWIQDSKLGSLRLQIATRQNAHAKTEWATEDQAKTGTQQPVPMMS